MSYDGGQYLRKINYPYKKMLSTEENEIRLVRVFDFPILRYFRKVIVHGSGVLVTQGYTQVVD